MTNDPMNARGEHGNVLECAQSSAALWIVVGEGPADFIAPSNRPKPKRQRTAAVQNLAALFGRDDHHHAPPTRTTDY